MKSPRFQSVRLLNTDSSKNVPVKENNNSLVVYWKDIESQFEGIPLSLYTNVRFKRGRDKKLLEPLRIKRQSSEIVVQEETSSDTDIQHALSIAAVRSTVLECHELQMNEHKISQDKIDEVLNKSNAIFRAIFELQEYSIPRLFILLPQKGSKLSSLSGSRFRLYFLCECDENSTSTNGNVSQKIHFARHGGYELTRQSDFIRKYGPHVRKLLAVIQNLSKLASVAIPVLNLADLCDEARKWLDITKDGILPLIDFTSKCLIENLQSASDGFTDIFPPPLNGPELRILNTFIAGKDNSQTLGNLFRTLTPEGNVKWVCEEHFQENVKDWDVAAFRSSIAQFNGKLELALGRVTVNLKLETVEKFYEIFNRHAAFIQELVVTMEWKPTTSHLKELRNAIKSSKVESLIVYCKPEKGLSNRSAIDSFNLSRKAYPLMQLMSVVNIADSFPDGRLRNLVVHGLRDVLQDSKYIPISNRLHSLGMDCKAFSWKDKGKLFKLLLGASHLTKLILSSGTLDTAREMAKELAIHGSKLTTVEVDTESNDRAVFHIESGNISTVDVTLGNAALKEVASWGDIKHLKVRYRVEQGDHGILQEIFSNCQSLTDLEIECPVEKFCSMFQLLSAAAKDHQAFRSVRFHDSESELLTTNIWNAFETTTLQLQPENETLLGFELAFWLFGWVPSKAVVLTPITDDQMATLHKRVQSDKTSSRLQELHLNISLLTSKGLSLLETLLGQLELNALKLTGSHESSEELLRIINTHGAKTTFQNMDFTNSSQLSPNQSVLSSSM
ncbi:hypothetical protein EDD21DRAFT_348847 [Dissophora ornata]|nr:hypothetical protein EDD21DRAFT_348847 [Dissophora ornata]